MTSIPRKPPIHVGMKSDQKLRPAASAKKPDRTLLTLTPIADAITNVGKSRSRVKRTSAPRQRMTISAAMRHSM